MSPVQTARAEVVLTAATRWEASPLCAGLGLRPSGEGSWTGRVGAGPVTLLKTGMGARAASAALSRISGAPGLVVSTGFAGALQADLRTGDLVAEQLTPCPQAAKALESAAVGVGLVARFGRIQDADFVLTRPEQKQEAGARTGALAVDMESAAVRAWARAHGLPALALRIIFDERDHALPSSMPGGEGLLNLAVYAALNPLAWPRLAALWPLQRRAAAALTSTMRAFLEAL